MRRLLLRLEQLERQLPPQDVRVVFVELAPDGQLVVWPTGEPYRPVGEVVSVRLEWDDEALLQAQEQKGSDTAHAG
ncbi:hypothetical protein HRbin27_00162 [bacterium HR27]|nr:hypothetical protein HRbin27_00162 [bacterium HR27]